MKDVLMKNWTRALSEVLASIAGTVGIVFLIALVVSQQSNSMNTLTAFTAYFQGGQIGLPILAVSGIIFIAIGRHGRLHAFLSLILYVVFFGAFLSTAFMIGLNPGFQTAVLSPSNLSFLWLLYCSLHILWFLVLALEPAVPSAQEAADAQEGRVNKIKTGAADRA